MLNRFHGVAICPALALDTPHEASLFPPIPANGAADAYDFELVGAEDVRARVAAVAERLVRIVAPDIDLDDVYVSCFEGRYNDEALDVADAFKLNVASSVPAGGFVEPHPDEEHDRLDFGGDDTNEPNVIERNIQLLRDRRASIGRELAALNESGCLTQSVKEDGVARIAAVNAEIAGLQKQKAGATLPVYYATPFRGLLNEEAEDNPLAYAGDLRTMAHLAFYDGAALHASGIKVTKKSDEQLRIHARGRDIMRHCLAIMHVVFNEDTDQ